MRTRIALALLIIAGGCKSADSTDRRNDTPVVTPPVAASATSESISITDSGPVAAHSCGVSGRADLTDEGIGELRPARTVAEVKRLCDVASDARQAGPEGQTERVLVVNLGGETVAAIAVDDKVWRLEVRTPRFTTKDSLGVDTPLRRIARMRGAQFAPGEDGVYGFVAAHCGMSFRFSLPMRPPAGGQWSVASIEKDHGDAVVDRVLVRKCS